MWTVRSESHSPQGSAWATSRSAAPRSSTMPRSRSTQNMLPGPRRPFSAIVSSGTWNEPASEETAIQPSWVISQRPGRRPLRSSVAPTSRPSVKTIAAGPSHGSISRPW